MVLLLMVAARKNNNKSRTRTFCSDYRLREYRTFYPLRQCQRSNSPRISATNTDSFEKCSEFAKGVKALALNYGRFNISSGKYPRNLFEVEREKKLRKENNYTIYTIDRTDGQATELFNCEALACPESVNFSTIVNDTRYDYYSLYTNPIPPTNITCLPGIGVFVHSNKYSNFSDAVTSCQWLGGSLAHIISEHRTNALSDMVLMESYNTRNSNLIEGFPTSEENGTSPEPYVRLRHAWVGLHEVKYSDRFLTTTELEPIECFLYRAWHPGHPSFVGGIGCVGITDERSWKLFDCRKVMPFICELYTSGPNNKVSLKGVCSAKRSNNRN